MKVKLEMKFIYGRILYFPQCQKSKYIAEWFNKKTLSQIDVETLKKLDFEVEIISKNYTTILKKEPKHDGRNHRKFACSE